MKGKFLVGVFLQKKHLANNMEVFFLQITNILKSTFVFAQSLFETSGKFRRKPPCKKHLAQYDFMTENKAISREAL